MEGLLAEVLNTISRLELFATDKGGIFIIEGDRMRMIANVGHSAAFLQLHKDMKVGDCLCGIVAQTGEILISVNSTHDARHTIVVPDTPPHGHLIVPLKTKDRVEGVMDLYIPADSTIDEAKVRLMQSIGSQLGIAIENARLYEATKSLSLHDSLTGLWNHEEIHRILDTQLARADREGTSVAVIMADLDHFKKVNDTYGHIAGDTVLRVTAELMRSLVRPYDAVGRYGGEEFLIVLPGCDAKHVAGVAERFRKRIGGERINTPEGMIPVTVSMGVAASDKGKRRGMNTLVRAADSALYRAKENGRNRVEFALDDE
jgi:diguanylate cyclase (GGDEF)-like protein